MAALNAVKAVLAAEGGPLHYREITERILKRGLWTSDGKTPEATINSRIVTDIQKRGDASVFQRTAPGTFALRSAQPVTHPTAIVKTSSAAKPPVKDQPKPKLNRIPLIQIQV